MYKVKVSVDILKTKDRLIKKFLQDQFLNKPKNLDSHHQKLALALTDPYHNLTARFVVRVSWFSLFFGSKPQDIP